MGTVPGQDRPPTVRPAVPRRAWTDFVDRLRDAATTEPGRLRIIGAVLAVLVLAFGAATVWEVAARHAAAHDVIEHSAPLSANAAEIYRSLADADATVAGGFLVGGQQPKDVSDRYDGDIANAAKLIADASANSAGFKDARTQLAALNSQLPQYTELVATAQADNRQGLPLGGAYLRYADSQMRKDGGLLDSANKLYQMENSRLNGDYSDAKKLPYFALAVGVIAIGALVWAQRRHYQRTNRVFNQGMLAATAFCVVALLWLAVAQTVARADLDDSFQHGGKSIQVLNNARVAVLQARGDENLTLVARGSGDQYESSYTDGMSKLAGPKGSSVGGELAQALKLADKDGGRAPVQAAIDEVGKWRQMHAKERSADDGGDYTTAVAEVIGGKDSKGDAVSGSTKQSFDAVETSLSKALTQEQGEFLASATDGHTALDMLTYGAGTLAILAANAALIGLGRRLSEYR